MIERITNGFIWILMLVFALNSVYVFLFKTVADEFLVFGFFDVGKWTAGFIYLGLAFSLFLVLRDERNKKINK